MPEGQGVSTPSAPTQTPTAPVQSPGNIPIPGNAREPSKANSQPSTPQAPEGQSATGAPDPADKAAKAAKQGRELTDKELQFPVTRIINGQKVTRSIAEWIGAGQLEQASHERFKTAQQLAQQAQNLIKLAQENPRKFLEATGKDPDEFARMTLSERVDWLAMTAEQQELHQFRQDKKQREDEAEKQRQQAEQDKMSKEDQTAYNAMVEESLKAWQASGLPEDPYFGQRMAAEMMRHRSQGISLTWNEAASIVKQDVDRVHKKVLTGLGEKSGEELANYLGPDLRKKLREYEVSLVQARQQRNPSQTRRPSSSDASNKKQDFVNNEGYDAFWERKRTEFSN